MTYKIAIVLDRARMERVRSKGVQVKDLYGGYLKVVELEVPDELAKRILAEFPRARIDARGFIEETPIAFKRELFDNVVRMGGPGPAAIEDTMRPEKLARIKELASREDEYLPPPS